MHTIGEIIAHFAGGAESVTLSRAEWTSIIEIVRQYSATRSQLRLAENEAARVKRIARPLWQACKKVGFQNACMRVPRVAVPGDRMGETPAPGYRDRLARSSGRQTAENIEVKATSLCDAIHKRSSCCHDAQRVM
jgi:hypothetical protein